MKKFIIGIAVIMILLLGGAGVFAAGLHQAAHRFEGYAYAADADTGGLEHVYTAEITYNNLYLPDGSIVRKMQVYVDKNGLCKGLAGLAKEGRAASVDAVLGAINSNLHSQNYPSTYDRGENLIDIPLQEFGSATDMYLAMGYTGYDSSGSSSRIVWGAWANTYVSRQQTLYSDIKDTIIETIADDLTDIDGLDAEDIAYIYNLGVDSSESLISSDAENIYYYSGLSINIHKFVMSNTNLDRTITLYQKSPNYITYYLMIMGIVALPVGALVAYAATRKKTSA